MENNPSTSQDSGAGAAPKRRTIPNLPALRECMHKRGNTKSFPDKTKERENEYEWVVQNLAHGFAAAEQISIQQPNENELCDFLAGWKWQWLIPQGRHQCSGEKFTYWTIADTMRPKNYVEHPVMSALNPNQFQPTPTARAVIRVDEEAGNAEVFNSQTGKLAFIGKLPDITNCNSNIKLLFKGKNDSCLKEIGSIEIDKFITPAYPDVGIQISNRSSGNMQLLAEKSSYVPLLAEDDISGQISVRTADKQVRMAYFNPGLAGLHINFSGIAKSQGSIRALILLYCLKKAYTLYRYHRLPMPSSLIHRSIGQPGLPRMTPAIVQYVLATLKQVRLRQSAMCGNYVFGEFMDRTGRVILTYRYSKQYADAATDNEEMGIMDNYGQTIISAAGLNEEKAMIVYDMQHNLIGRVENNRFFDKTDEIMHILQKGNTELKVYLKDTTVQYRVRGEMCPETYGTVISPEIEYIKPASPNFEIISSKGNHNTLVKVTPEDTTTRVDVLSHFAMDNQWRAMVLAYSVKIALNRHNLDRLPIEERAYEFLR